MNVCNFRYTPNVGNYEAVAYNDESSRGFGVKSVEDDTLKIALKLKTVEMGTNLNGSGKTDPNVINVKKTERLKYN